MTSKVNHEEHKANWDFSQIDEFIYLGADMCCGGDHYEYLHNVMDIRSDIDVKKERLETPSELLDIFLWLPVVDKTAPTLEQLQAGVGAIKAAVDNKSKIFVHCRLGHGRSPTIVAAYFVSLGMSVKEAIEKIKLSRPEIHLNAEQVNILNQYKKNLQAK